MPSGAATSPTAPSQGVVALIVDGAVRDVSQLREVGLPVFARDVVTAAAPVYSPKGEVNVPIACGEVVVFPGDIIVADEDGIVVIPHKVSIRSSPRRTPSRPRRRASRKCSVVARSPTSPASAAGTRRTGSILTDTALRTALEVRGVSKAYGAVEALIDVSFDVRAGSVLGLIGETAPASRR